MSQPLSIAKPWQTAVKHLVVSCGCIGLSLLAIAWFGFLPKIQAAENTTPDLQVSGAPTNIQPKLVANYGKLPLSFEANQGQVSGAVQFLSRGLGYTLFLTGDEAVLSLGKAADAGLTSGVTTLLDKPTTDNGPGATESVLRMKLIGASAGATVTGAEELPGKSNYFIGNDPSKWRTNVPNYAQVRYQNVYPGVDLVYYGTQGGQLEYDFVVAPGADPHSIGLSFQGAGHIRVDKGTGDLVLVLDGSELRFRKPVVYQEQFTVASSQLTVQDEKRNTTDNPKSKIQNRKFLDGRFVLAGKNQVGFQVAAYDHRAPLIIDPVLVYSTFLGGGQVNIGYRVAVDASGSAYVAGATNSTDFPTTAGVFKSLLNPGGCPIRVTKGQPKKVLTCPDAFVTKLDPTGTQLVYSTYLGGSISDVATGISVDSSGNVYVTGTTGSTDFPTTVGAFQNSAIGDRMHAFATKLNATGSALIYSTYLGGSHYDGSTISAIDSSGYLYLAGGTNSPDFPTTHGAFQTVIAGTSCFHDGLPVPCVDGFIAKLNQQGTGLIYSTYLGGSNGGAVLGLAVDSSGSAYATGATVSTNFPTANPLQPSFGTTTCGSSPLPQPCAHAFVTKLNPTGTALTYSTYLGGNGDDAGIGIAVDPSGAAYVTGATNSTNFPTTAGAAQTTFGGGTCHFSTSISFGCSDAFVAKLEPSGTSLAYSTYLGGSDFDLGWAIAVDNAGNAYVVGGTDSIDFPTDAATGNFQGGTCSTNGLMFVLQTRQQGTLFNCPNAFLTEIDPTGSTLLFSTYLGGVSGDVAFSVAVDPSGSVYMVGSTVSSNFPITAGALQTSMTGYVDAFVSKFGPPPAATPTFSVPAGSYTSPQSVTISDATAGASIFYTTDGTEPTPASTPYTGAIPVGVSQTIEAMATASGHSISDLAIATYTITLSTQTPAATPSFSIPSGTYTSAPTVAISDTTPGATIYYTTNGTTPSTASTRYTSAFTVNSTETIEAIAVAAGYNDSAVATATYTIGAWNEWTWMGGSSTVGGKGQGQSGVYGRLGTPAAGNIPGGRWVAKTWTDSSGNVWLFGGYGVDSTGAQGELNDLWEFNPSTQEWAWMGGSSTVGNNGGQSGVYGLLNTPASANVPGGRDSSSTWTDSSGNFWLFGGDGYDSTGTFGYLNDLWEFNPSTQEWAWMGGSSTVGDNDAQSGVYGTLGIPAAGNVPGGRIPGNSWTDNGGNFWLFGGVGVDSTGTWGELNDLWEFNPSTQKWAWMGGSSTVGDNGGQSGVYGLLNTPAYGNVPGGRDSEIGWTDNRGNFWLFGGEGYDSTGNFGYLNDLWEFNPSNRLWTWVGGSSTVGNNGGQPGVYGTLGTPAAGNVPGSRYLANSWTDSSGNFWLFGGYGFDSTGNYGYLNDLWEFNPYTKEWTWMGGSSIKSVQPGVYGTLGTPAAGNIPGPRLEASTWTDGNGNLWLFGGYGADSTATHGYLNDLWEYQPSAPTLPAATPTFSVASGTYSSPQTVTISDTTTGATIYYTTNGTTPTTSSTRYNGAITVNSTATLEAIATAQGYSASAVAIATYTIEFPIAGVSPGSLTFSSQALGTTSASQPVTLSNTGTLALTITSIAPSANFGESDNCAGSVAAGGSCTINVTFTPTATGTLTGTLTITDNSNNVAGSTQTVGLSGAGTPAATTTSISAPSVTYPANGSVTVTVTSVAGTVTGNVSLSVDGGSLITQALSSGSSIFTITSPTGGSHSLSASYAAQGNFAASSTTGTLQVNQANPTVTFTGAPATAAYNSSFTVASTTNASTTAVITASGSCSIVRNTVTMTNGTGICNLTANWAADSNYNSATASQSTTATKLTPTVTFTGAPSTEIYNSSFSVASTTNASTTVVITASGACSVTGNTVTMTSGTGTCSLTANWAADSNYNSATASQSTAAAKATSSTVITSNLPNPSIVGQAVTVSFRVTGNGTPTGSVTVNASTGETCSGSLSAGAGSCSVVFNSGGARTVTATYGGDTNFSGGASAAVNQTVNVPAASLSATSEAFGNQVINTTSAIKTVTLTSTGNTNLAVSSITITGTNAGDFGETNKCPASLAPGAKCTISLTYTPTVLGAETASLTVTDNAANSPQTVALSGSGESPVVLSPTSLSFGNQAEGTTSTAKTVTLTNNLSTALAISSVTTSADFGQTNTCGTSVPAKGKCTISVTYAPSIIGGETGTLTVTDAASNSPQTATLTGTGVAPVTLAPTTLAFGSVVEGNTSAGKVITVTNVQNVALTGISVSTTNTDYTLTNGCGTSLAAGQKCTITVTFTPSVIGTDNATVNIFDSAANSPQTAALTGTGTTPVTLTPTSATYASQTVGTTSAAKAFTLTSSLTGTLNNIAISTTGEFAVSSTTCGTSLAGKGKCTINVVFKPTAKGITTGTLSVSDSAGNSPQAATLTGTGK